jgi:hypothetical protein
VMRRVEHRVDAAQRPDGQKRPQREHHECRNETATDQSGAR